MKRTINNLCLLPVLLTALSSLPTGRATAQTFTNLHNFIRTPDGGNSATTLILSSNTLYGTASGGGSMGNGTVFAINADGTGFTNLHSFVFGEGINPFAGLVLSGTTLFGTASQGGAQGNGTIFAINTDGTGVVNLRSFTGGNDGANPYDGLVLAGDTLYGTASQGGGQGNGTVFALNTNGLGFANLHSFTGGSDGAAPNGGLVLGGDVLYGTASQGGGQGNGAVFAVNTNGLGFTNLYSFTGGNDGASPSATLVLAGNVLYGVASYGGPAGQGVVFAVNTNGLGFTNLYSFTGGNDGGYPASVIVSNNALYGTTSGGGSSSNGTVFVVNTDGTGFMTLYGFSANPLPNETNNDGVLPRGGLLLASNTLYGTTFQGGTAQNGTVFAVILTNTVTAPPNPIPLQIAADGQAVVLSWTNSAFTLQSAPSLSSTFTNIPGATSSYTNPITSPQLFFRLISN